MRLIAIIFLLILSGCTTASNKSFSQGESMSDLKTVTLETNKGAIRFKLFENRAPITTMNFTQLVNNNFYDGLTFHRYVPGFVIQGGDPAGNGTGGSKNKIKLEVHSELKHTEGAVAMARSQHPDSASSQFYITLAPQPSLDGNYAVFGQVVSGMDVVKSLRESDVINTVKITE